MRIILYIGFIVLCKWLAILYEWPLMEIFIRSLTLLLVISVIEFISVYFGVRITLECEQQRVVRGQKIPITIIVNNMSLVPATMVRIRIVSTNELHGMKTKCDMELPVRKWGRQDYVVSMVAGSCGRLSMSVTKMRVKDVLGIIKMGKKVRGESRRIAIVPTYSESDFEKPVTNNNVYIDSDSFSKEKPGDDPSEIFDIRPMKEGDSVKRINWKMSLRMDEYMVNEYSLPVGNGTVIMLDTCFNLDKDRIPIAADMLFVNLMRVSLGLQEYEITHQIVWYNNELNICESREITPDDDITEIFMRVYDCGIYSGQTKLAYVYDDWFSTAKMSHLYYIASDLDVATVYEIARDKENIIKKIYCPVIGNKREEIQDLCESLNIELE